MPVDDATPIRRSEIKESIVGKFRTRFHVRYSSFATASTCAVLLVTAAPLSALPAQANPIHRGHLLQDKVVMETMPPLEGQSPGPAASRSMESQPSTDNSATTPLASANFRTLQLNLCNGGTAACYKDNLVIQEAVMTIGRLKPDLVSFNEICLGDLTINRTSDSTTLLQAMRKLWPSDYVYHVFMPALQAGTEDSFKCTNGESFGSALVFHIAPANDWGVAPYGFVYDDQLPTTTEWRTAACASVYYNYLACTTHLAAGNNAKPVAMKQCNAMMNYIIPTVKNDAGVRLTSAPTLIQGDLNLKYDDGDDNVQKCIPQGFTRKGDSDVQHIIISDDASFVDTNLVGMTYTDHVAFVANLKMP
jgi:hypothetical protein